jgi:hypothetical protein
MGPFNVLTDAPVPPSRHPRFIESLTGVLWRELQEITRPAVFGVDEEQLTRSNITNTIADLFIENPYQS